MRIHGPEPRHADAEQIRALYLAAMHGWNAGSGEAFAAPFTDDVDFIAFDGARFRGRDELIRFHDPLFKTHLKGTRLVGDVTDVRFLAPDVAVLHAYGGTVSPGKREPAPERDSLQTLVAIRRDNRWQLTAFQNTRIRPIGQNHLGTLLWLITDWFWKWCLPAQHERPRYRVEESLKGISRACAGERLTIRLFHGMSSHSERKGGIAWLVGPTSKYPRCFGILDLYVRRDLPLEGRRTDLPERGKDATIDEPHPSAA